MLKTNIKSILFLVMLCITLFLITTRGDDFFLSEAVTTFIWVLAPKENICLSS